ncbi:MAG TPA: peptidylprolyl isomerase [Planctomycetota bacterium]|nr:peptidylprolyl isomerase [Planctomycetota bacterium]
MYRRTVLALLFTAALAFCVRAEDKKPIVIIETSMGNIDVELDAEKAPITVKNFLNYVDEKFYDGTIFHRVMDGFMIQGGGFTPDLKEKPTKATIKNEADNGLKNLTGTIAMARLPDPHSASAQFYINVADNANLDHRGKSDALYGYCVFGKVVAGMDVVNKIKAVQTGTKAGEIQGQRFPMSDVPLETITIKSIRKK